MPDSDVRPETSSLLRHVEIQTVESGSASVSSVDIEGPASGVRGSSWYASSFLVINAVLGAGLLNFPHAYHAAGGVMVAILIQAFLMIFIVSALFILAWCSDVSHSATYQDVIYSICGRRIYIMCSVCIVLYCYGTCTTFLIVIADQLDRFFYFLHGFDFCHVWYLNRTFTMTVSSVCIILPICFPKRIDFLKYTSAVGVLGVVYLEVLIVSKYLFFEIHPGPIRTSPDSWVDVFMVIPAICFGYQCHVSVIPIYSCLEKRHLPEFAKVVATALVVVILTYSIGTSFGYWTFGDDIAPDILENYKPDAAVLVGVFMMAAKTYTTYPIILFCGRAGVESLRLVIFPGHGDSYERLRRYTITIIWFCSNVLLAVYIPDIGVVISFMGSLATGFIFIFPGGCLLKLSLTTSRDKRTRRKNLVMLIMACMFLVLGSFMLGMVFVQSVLNVTNPLPAKVAFCV